jgi:hypothetical protein
VAKPDVDSQQVIEIVRVSAFDHRLCSAATLFGRLEEQFQRPVKVNFSNAVNNSETDCCVCVVATSVHVSLVL